MRYVVCGADGQLAGRVEELTGRKAKSAAEVAPLYKAMWAADVDNWLKIK